MIKKIVLPSFLVVTFFAIPIGFFNSFFFTSDALLEIDLSNSPEISLDSFGENLEEIRKKRNIPGISVSVISKGQKEAYVAGFSDLENEDSLSPDHFMLTGSVGKSFFAAAILHLQGKDIINIDEKVYPYLGKYDWYNTLPNATEITIRSLLNHTSGIPEYIYTQSIWQSLRDNPEKEWTIGERLSLLANSDAQFQVGNGWSYADTNYIILGALLEELTAQNVYEFVEHYLLKPNSVSSLKPSIEKEIEGLSAGYTGGFFANLFGEKISSKGVYVFNPQIEWTGGGYASTSSSLAVWIEKLYTGEILNKEDTKLMFSPVNRQTGGKDKTGYGLGAEIFETRYGRGYGHTGFMPGYSTFMAYFPSLDLSLAFQMNTDPFNQSLSPGTSTFSVADDILAELIPEPSSFKKETTIYFVRHGEREDDGTRDPELSEMGKKRAKELIKQFSHKDLTGIYSSPYQRTMQTANPISGFLNIPVSIYNPNDINSIFEMIANNEGNSILIIGHSNTIPSSINYLLKEAALEQIPEDEYNNIFKVVYSSKTQSLESSKQTF